MNSSTTSRLGILAVLSFPCFAATGLNAASPAISAGSVHSLFLKTDGTAWAAGQNAEGEYGIVTTTSGNPPVQVMTGVKAITAGYLNSLFLKTDGSAWASGFNPEGQLGDGTTTDRSTAAQVLTGVQAIAAGASHSLFLKTDGSVWATGRNYEGEFGDGTTTSRSSPVQVLTGVKAIATGNRHSLFLKTDGTVWATGFNAFGELGDGTTTNRYSPVQVMTGVKAISAGNYHSLFLKTDGTVWATGNNADGEYGDGTTPNVNTPKQVMTAVKAISAGWYHSLFLKTDGTVWATGRNDYGQLGDGTTTNRNTSAQVLTGGLAISGGGQHSLFLKTDGSVWATGYNKHYQLGLGTGPNLSTPTPLVIALGVPAPAIALEAPTGTPVSNGAGTLAYGSIAPGQTRDLSVTVSNTGGSDLSTIAATFTGPDAGQFSLVSSPPVTLAAGASAAFTVRFSPTSLGSKSATLSIASTDSTANPFTAALTGTAVTSPEAWRSQYFQTTAITTNTADNADPDFDGLLNLVERAFNLDPTQPGNPILVADTGTTGLPLVRLTGQPAVFSIQYLRRKASTNSGLTYTPQFASSLDGTWAAATGTETVVSIDSEWERVTITDTAPDPTTRFGRVMVSGG